MGTDNDIKRSFRRYAAVLTIFAAIFLFVKRDNIVRWIQSGVVLARQERQIKAYEEDNARLDREIRMMSTDKDTLEKFARETFGFAAPGDDVYVEE